MKQFTRLAAAVAFVVAPAPVVVAHAQAAPATQASATPPNTPGAVIRVVHLRLKSGQAPAFWRDVQQHLKPIYEEEKRAGILTDYSFATKTTADSENDWNVSLRLTYPSWASLDNMAQRTDPITLKHYGNAEARTAANTKRTDYATVVESLLMRQQRINDLP
jgi:hypothetical protein